MADAKLNSLISALNAYGIPVQAVPNVPVVTQPNPPTLQASVDGTSILPGSGYIYDKGLTQWAITGKGVIARNGILDKLTQRVMLVVWLKGVVHQRNADANWWMWDGINNAWVAENDPTQTSSLGSTAPGMTTGSPPSDASAGQWQDGQAAGMNYKLLLPAGYNSTTRYPVILYLHQLDMGTDWKDLGGWLDNWFNTPAVRSKHQFILVAPLLDQSADQSGQTINFGGVTSNVTVGRDSAVACLGDVMHKHSFDPNRVYVTGNSLGGIGSWELVAQYPSMFAAAMPLAGANYYRDPATTASMLRDKPIWAIHGSQDGSVPIQWDRRMRDEFANLGAPHYKYTELDMGHDVWDTVYPDPQYLGWLMSQSMTGSVNSSSPTPTTPPSTPTPPVSATPTPTGFGLPLSSGYMSTRGNQIVDSNGTPQRIASIGWNQGFDTINSDIKHMRQLGFNCIRVSWVDATLQTDLTRIDTIIVGAMANGMKVILDHHTNEQGTAADGWGSQQKNGLPWDVGPGTDGTNGAGVKGTVSRSDWITNWSTVVARYANSDVLIGCDLHNEPLRYGLSSWATGSADDLLAAYQDCGNAIQAINKELLIICEGAQDYSIEMPWGDLSVVKQAPVRLGVANKVVYSVHNYPATIGGFRPDSGPQYQQLMDKCFGYLMREDIAPVWIGEIGARMENGSEVAWADSTVGYINSIVLRGGDQPMGTDWWAWGQLDGQQPNGVLSNGQPRPEQQIVWSKLLFNR